MRLFKKEKTKITNTAKDEIHPEWLMGGNPGAILEQEARGQKELCSSSQLPCNSNDNLLKIFKKYGIKLAKGKKDPLFYNVNLPEGWKIEPTDHSMWSKLKDDKGNVIADIFYKAAFYDRRAMIHFVKETKEGS